MQLLRRKRENSSVTRKLRVDKRNHPELFAYLQGRLVQGVRACNAALTDRLNERFPGHSLHHSYFNFETHDYIWVSEDDVAQRFVAEQSWPVEVLP